MKLDQETSAGLVHFIKPTLLQKLPTDLITALHAAASTEECLEILTISSLEPGLTDQIFAIFEPIFVDIATRWSLQKSGFDLSRAISAFSRVLPFAPYLRSFAHAALEAITSSPDAESEFFTPNNDNQNLHSLFALFRLLSFDSSFFSNIVSPTHLERLFHNSHPTIRYLAVRCFSLYIHAADAATEDMLGKYVGQNAVEGTWENITIDYRLLSLWEERRWIRFEKDLTDIRNGRDNAGFEQWIHQQHSLFARSSTEIGGVIVPSMKSSATSYSSSLVPTSTVLYNLKNIGRALLSNDPILLIGQSGSGKTSLINDIARKIGQADSMVTLHLNEQTDSKSLLGVYSSTHAGSFSWQPGVLTQAAKEGRWVLIEDLDRAPPEVLGLILPLIENRQLPIPSRGECIRCADDFRVIATIRSTLNAYGEESIPGTNMLGIRLWNRISLSPLPLSEVEDVIIRRYSLLESRIKMIISIYQRISSRIVENLSRKSLQRATSLRDLMKFCQRVQRRLEHLGCQTGYEPVPQSFNLKIFMDAADCFAAYLPAGPSREALASEIAQDLQISPQQVNYCFLEQIPQYLDTRESLTVGRESCTKRKLLGRKPLKSNNSIFAPNRPSLRTMEQVAAAINTAEPVLLVGETGIGKTAVVQQLATLLHQRLTVVNLSQQSESTDLLGGFKPVNLRSKAVPLVDEFNILFESTFSAKKNQKFLDSLRKSLLTSNWTRLITISKEAIKMANSVFEKRSELSNDHDSNQPSKKRRLDVKYADLQQKWESFANDLNEFEARAAQGDSGFSFAFVQGKIVKALRDGEWVLLDEINLASPDTLESIASLLNSGNDGAPSVLLSEAGEIDRVYGDPNFRIFGAMNPATDAGKKDLVPGLRSRFTEIFVNPPDSDIDDLISLINAYLGPLLASDEQASALLAQLYLDTKKLGSENRLTDGAGQKPHFSIRTLVRTLVYVREQASVYGLRRAMFEGFSMSFLTMLSKDSERLIIPLLEKHIFGDLRNARSVFSQTPKVPQDGQNYVRYKHYWMKQGAFEPENQPQYIITPFIERNLMNLVRAGSIRRFPILLQGPTSSGKTSMVEYLAKVSGNRFVRINNHEHTDLQEYLGSYVSGEDGTLRYQEGVLVEALRNGYWIVLDELNLAPTDVLEALNRLLDDNRELFIPETQEIVYPHPNFMLFATQNPAGLYGGRKVLSRAFRNRFLELHFDDIPEDELEFILKERSQIAPSFCARIVSVYKRLSILRQSNRLFEQRNSFATLRDLFRWALRRADDREQLAINGFMLLSERVRNVQEREAVKSVIEEVMKVKLDTKSIYSEDVLKSRLQRSPSGIIWTPAMRRIFILVSRAIENNEPVLLVGETGCGKTQICQAIAEACEKELHVINAHVNLETGDIIGSQRPVRNRASIEQQLFTDLSVVFPNATGAGLRELSEEFSKLDKEQVKNLDAGLVSRIRDNTNKARSLFLWSNGALVTAMETGQHFLLDEISLADDSVLERLNSVLEPARSLLLAEKGAVDSSVVAKPGFQFLATMNPGGDYGKRELSAALRNRLTEIWVPQLSETEDILPILESKLQRSKSNTSRAMLEFAKWFRERFQGASSGSMSIRDLLAWVDFVNTCTSLDLDSTIVHGAALVYIDTLGANPSAMLASSTANLDRDRREALDKLSSLFSLDGASIYYQPIHISFDSKVMNIGPFSLPLSSNIAQDTKFALDAPTTLSNTLRIARGLQSSKPILLEGSPGVGKTTLIVTLAHLLDKPLTRINLSEQTDLTDLFGSDVPVEGSDMGNFAWNDAPFLRALQNGGWVLLDEMNLASQSVLEGLNSCLDHRQEVYVTELDQTFKRHPDFVLFAAQNPHHQGGGRKGLPTSFVNRFTVVFADAFTPEDLKMICSRISSIAPEGEIERMVQFVSALHDSIVHERRLGMVGGPWELNLRDISRWLQLLETTPSRLSPSQFLDVIVSHRFRTVQDRDFVSTKYQQIFAAPPEPQSYFHNLALDHYQVGFGQLPRNSSMQNYYGPSMPILTEDLETIESLMLCINQGWPSILAGPTGCGKTTILRKLASLNGSRLVELSLNAETDTMDLIGGFEQIDIQRYISAFIEELSFHVRHLIIIQLSNRDTTIDASLLKLQQIIASTQLDLNAIRSILSSLALSHNTPELIRFSERCTSLLKATQTASKVGFEWTEGLFLQAVQNGHWVVLDNANLCNSSVLDRLNSLMEPNGTLTINEQRTGDGSAKTIFPHSNFRLFLTMDPRHGELSRAMRNRCVEICFLPRQRSETYTTPALVYSQESLIYRLRPCHELSMLSPGHSPDQALFEVAFDHLSSKDLSFLQTEAAKSVCLYHESTPSLHSLLDRYTSVFASSSLPSLFSRIGIQISSALQPINTLINEPLLAGHASNELKTHILELTKLQELYLDVFRFHQVLISVIDSATTKKPSEMTPLERSISSARIASLRKESTQPAGNFLHNCSQAMGHFIQNYGNTSFVGLESINMVRSILDICWDFFKILQSSQFNEGLFQAYLQSARQFLRRREGIDSTILHVFSQSLATFNADWGLSSGQSMQLIWSAWRPITAKHLSHLELVLKLRHLSTRFDYIALRSHQQFGELSQLRSSLLKAQVAVVSGAEDEHLIKNLDAVISGLENQFSSLNPIDGAFFAAEFEALSQYHDFLTCAEPASNLVESLQLLAGRVSCPHDVSSSNNSIPGLLSRISSFAGFSNLHGRPVALQGTLALSVIQKFTSMDMVPLKSMDLLESELEILRRGFSSNAQLLQTDQLDLLQGKMRLIFKELLVLHRDFLDSGSLNAVCEALEEPSKLPITNQVELQLRGDVGSDSYLTNFSKTTFKNCITSLLQHTDSRQEKAFHCGMASIRLAVACLWFFVPNKPFDPCLSLTVEHERHNARCSAKTAQIDALKLFETIFSGQNSSLRIRLLQNELRSLGESPPLPPLSRPLPSQLHELHGELLNLFNTILSQDLEQSIFSDAQCNLLRKNITQIRTRLANYHSYNDIVVPVIRFLEILDTGVFLVQQSRAVSLPNNTLSSVRAISEITPFLASQQKDLSKATFLDHETGLHDETRLHIHRLAVLGVLQNTDESTLSVESHRQSLYQTLNVLYSIWKDRLSEDQKKEAARSSLYRHQGSYEEEVHHDDSEFRQLFPQYEEEGANSSTESHLSTFDINTLATRISDVINQLFLPQDKEVAVKDLIFESTQLIGSILKKSPISSALVDPSDHLAGVLLLLDSSEAPRKGLYNFYSDPNPSEAKRFAQLTEKVQIRFSKLHEIWPEHATPLDVLKCCAEIFDFKHSDPVAKFITKAEKLHEFVHQWQLVASREFSAAGHYDELTNLLISWRRLELSTWAKLFDIEVENCKHDASQWWFIAYEVIIAAPLRLVEEGHDLSGHCTELASTLEAFFLSTSFGQYETRLQLVKQFKQLAVLYSADIPQLLQVVEVLANIYDHFVAFVPPIESALATGRKSLEKDLQEVVQLASWKDTNITALRESARRSHHKLFKYVRKFRECLAQSSAAILSQSSALISHPEPVPEFNLAVNALDEPPSVKFCRENLKTWDQRPIRLREPQTTVASMLRVYSQAVDPLEVSHIIEAFTTDIVQSIDDFKSQTPKTLTEDNKGEVQHLKSQKRRFFADKLKGLRHMGIRFNIGTDILEKQSSTSVILSSSPHIGVPENVPIAFSDAYFHRFLDLIPYVRLASRNYAEDLSNVEVARSVGCSEGLLHWILRQRDVLSLRLKQLSSFSSTVDKLKNVSNLQFNDVHFKNQSSPNRAMLRYALQRLNTMIAVSLSILQIHSRHSDSSSRDVLDEVKALRDQSSILLSSISELSELPDRITTSAHEDTCAKVVSFLESTRLELVDLINLRPETTFALQAVLPFTAITLIPNDIAETVSSISLDQFDQLFTKTTNKILVSMQKISAISETVSEDVQSWLQRSDQLLVKGLAELHMSEISTEVQQILVAVQHLPVGSSVASLAAAILASLTPIVQQYEHICVDLVSRYANADRDMCKMAYILAKSFVQIASEGFCSPQEASSEQGNSDKLEAGTGLGEGEGAEDISKDVQDDEDLSELAQEKQKDENNKDVDEDMDDAVNMDQEDLEADASDYEDEKEDDENKQEGEDDNNDLDEEAGSVDGLDADAVDEKMWDGKNDQGQKDTENDKGEGVGDDENDAAASEKDDKKEQNKEKEADADAEEKESGGEESEGEGSEVDEEGEAIGKEETEAADPFAKQEEALELPEDMELDGQNEENEDALSDDDMDNMSDTSNWAGQDQETEKPEEAAEESDANEMDDEGQKDDQAEGGDDNEDAADKPEEVDTPGEPEAEPQPEPTQEEENKEIKEKESDDNNADNENVAESEAVADGAGIDQDQNDDKGASGEAVQDTGSKDQGEPNEQVKKTDKGEESAETSHEAGGHEEPEVDKSTEALKTLGDILEEWHKRQQDIRNASEDQVTPDLNEDVDMENVDFEHLKDDNDAADTQALGQANEEEAKGLDQQKAVESAETPQDENVMPQPEESQENDDEQVMNEQMEIDQTMGAPTERGGGSFVANDRRPQEMPTSTESRDVQDELEDADTSLSALHMAHELSPLTSPDEAAKMWSHYESVIHDLSLSLTEQLRLILAPTMATKLRGDFRTGKRLNIKRIIPYIASNFKRDKIWMRRSIPSKRNYQIMLAVDDSRSMLESGSDQLAFETLALVSKSLSMLEAGDLCVVNFGNAENVRVAHEFGKPFSSESGRQIFQQFSFQQNGTNVRRLISDSISLFREAKNQKSRSSGADLWQLELIISDGICVDHESIRRLVRHAQDERIMIVFIIVDSNKGNSVLDLKEARFEADPHGLGEKKLRMTRYLEEFPFAYYLVVRDVQELPAVLSLALKQWFTEVVDVS